MRPTLKTVLLSLCLLFCLSLSPVAQAVDGPKPLPKPALWVMTDADSTLYLFGSVHVMKPDTPWLNPAIQTRFDSASEVWFEVGNIDDKAAMAPLTQKYMFDPAATMTDGLTEGEIKQLNALLAPMNLNTQMLKPMRKWAVGLLITLNQVQALGYSSENGIDVTLLAQARKTGKPVHGLETMEAQMQAVTPKTPAEDAQNLRMSLSDLATLPQDVDDLFIAWLSGDAAGLDRLMTTKMKTEDPEGYRHVLVERNASWVPEIETIMAGQGTGFITVGAGHLVGPDSVIHMLEARGYKVERVNY
ncbi:MAG: TraB/GumN family protein [Asticcacaulis sp.]